MITAVFFDLDGTLLPMDQEQFVKAYMNEMCRKMARYGYDPSLLAKAVWSGTGAMTQNDGSASNEAVFWQVFNRVMGRDCSGDMPLFEDFYRCEFQQVQSVCGFDAGAAEAVRQIRDMGLRTVLATNPLFPAIATHSRIRWAGLVPEDFEWITTYENSSRCKPNPDYYRQILGKLGLKAEECLMVGNDVQEDMVARTVGMKVFLLTDCLINRDQREIREYPSGSFSELITYIGSL